MKRLTVLTAVLMMTASTTGCRCLGLFNRGPSCQTCVQPAMPGCAQPMTTGYGDGYLSPPTVPPDTYAIPQPG
jgi:hypothetical protein